MVGSGSDVQMQVLSCGSKAHLCGSLTSEYRSRQTGQLIMPGVDLKPNKNAVSSISFDQLIMSRCRDAFRPGSAEP